MGELTDIGSTEGKGSKTPSPFVSVKEDKEIRRPLKVKDVKFIAAKVKEPDMPNYKAAMIATGAKDMNTASTNAARMLQNATLREALDEAMVKLGITIDSAVAPVREALEYEGDTDRDTLEMRLKGHDRAMKVLQIIGTDDQGTKPGTINFNFGTQNFVKKDSD